MCKYIRTGMQKIYPSQKKKDPNLNVKFLAIFRLGELLHAEKTKLPMCLKTCAYVGKKKPALS